MTSLSTATTSIPATPLPDTSGDRVSSPRDQATWLLSKIEESLDYVFSLRSRLQRWAASIRVVNLVLSGVVTVALGVRWPTYAETLRNVAFVVGAVATTFASLDLYFSYRGLWVEHEEAEWRLHRLRERVAFYLAGRTEEELNAATISGFNESYQWIWDNLSVKWLTLRRSANH